jgi:cold shock CspA family protein
MRGTIKHIVKDRNYGFIRADKTNGEYFFHKDDFNGFWQDLVDDSDSGNRKIKVEFEIAESPKGPRAKDVKRLDYPNA